MINLLIALLSGFAISALLLVWLTAVEVILPGVAVAAVAYYLLARRAMNKLQEVFLASQKELMNGRIEKAIRIMESARSLSRWQFMINSQINAQVGMIYYIREDDKAATPYLEKAVSRLWIPKAMLGALYFRKKNFDKMRENFEKAVGVGKKQGLAWSVYAWCEWKLGNVDKAIELLDSGAKKLGDDDERLKANLLSLRNGKKVKMKGYGDQWYQFRLEKVPMVKQRVRYARR